MHLISVAFVTDEIFYFVTDDLLGSGYSLFTEWISEFYGIFAVGKGVCQCIGIIIGQTDGKDLHHFQVEFSD